VAPAPTLSADAPALALFDLDGTLLDGDTDQLWCEFLMAEGVLARTDFAAKNHRISERYAAGTVTPAEFCAFYASTLAGRSPEQWAPQRERFVDAVIAPRLGAAARALLARHRAAGDEIVLTTATNRFLTEPIARLLGIAAANLIATELEEESGRFTGRNRAVLNMRDGKVVRIKSWITEKGLPETALARASFYSDSSNDLPLLRAVGRAVAVDPDLRLLAEAERVGWPVLRLARA
jgi:HAD superfamily hydrolase (TIGR01490 family)